jgi:hypothetical protein
MAVKDLEVFSVRASRGAGEKLKAWAEAEGLSQGRVLDAMFELYESRHEGVQPSTVEVLLRPMFRGIERELGRVFEEVESKGRLYAEEAEANKRRADALNCSLMEQKAAWEQERLEYQEKLSHVESELLSARTAREAAESRAREALEMGRALTTSLTEAQGRLDEVSHQMAGHAALLKERDTLNLQVQQLAMEKGMAELSLAAAREECQREREASQRSAETYRREIQALEKECEARFLKAELASATERLKEREEALTVKTDGTKKALGQSEISLAEKKKR